MADDDLVTTAELAARLKLSTRSIYRYYATEGPGLLADTPLSPRMGGEAVVRKEEAAVIDRTHQVQLARARHRARWPGSRGAGGSRRRSDGRRSGRGWSG